MQVRAAVNKLYNDRRIRLWVVYVDSFSGQGAVGWAESTMQISDFGDQDALLAVATEDRAYAFLVPSTIMSASRRRRPAAQRRSNPRCAETTGPARRSPRPTG